MPGTGIKVSTEDKVTENFNTVLEQGSQGKNMYFFYNAPPRNPSSKFTGRDLRLVLARTLE